MKRNFPKWATLTAILMLGTIAIFIAGLLASCETQSEISELPAVMITNIRERTLSISWTTPEATTGKVHYGSDPNNLDQIANDIRGSHIVDDTHYVTIAKLTPGTTYYFDVYSNENVDNNGGNHYTATTAPATGIPAVDTVYGQVFKADGITPAAGCIVYVTLEGVSETSDKGKALPLSSLTDENGWWYTNLADSRLPDKSAFFTYSQDDDRVHLVAQCANDGSASLTVSTSEDAPAPNLIAKTTGGSEGKTYLPLTINK